MAGAGNTTGCGLDPGKTTKMGRVANTAPGIRTNIEWRATTGDNRSRTTTAATGRAIEVVWIIGSSIDWIICFVGECEL